MEAYTKFSEVYDTFMDNVPYEEWAQYIRSTLAQYGIESGILLDLGCGTGSMTERLARYGYDMIGVDGSAEMLESASQKKRESGYDILYLQQDMRAFELYGTVRAVVSVCDCVNYITEPEELLQMFRLVNNYLDPGGIFIFDFNTAYKYREVLGDQTIAEYREDCSFIWDNYYDGEEKINEYELTLFVREPGSEDLYRRFQEVHFQRAYTLEEVRELIEKSGMEFLEACDGYTKETARENSERICIIARECGK